MMSFHNLSFPNTGFFSNISYSANRESLGADFNYEQMRLEIAGAGTFFDRYTFFSRALFETTLDEDAPYNALFWRGGFLELSGTVRNELFGEHFGLVQTVFYRRLGDITFLPFMSSWRLPFSSLAK